MNGLKVSLVLSSLLRTQAPAALVGAALLCAGCGPPATEAPTASSESPPAAEADSHAGHAHADADIAAAMAKLSPDDRALAEQQKVCIVAKEPLGSMGTPIKVEHDGQVAFLCCSGCKEAFEAEPEKFLAALKAGGDAAAVPAAEGETIPSVDPAAEAKGEGS